MRRTTLGPLSMNSDRRSSAKPPLGGRRPSSMAPPLSGAQGRRPSSLASRQSVAGRRGPSVAHAGRRTDTRPLKDRAYMQSCIRDIVGYVLENGYSFPISPKILTSPSSRDFQQIFLFLVRHFDPEYEFQRRFEDEIPALLKSYGYPMTISKSALSAVGSPHTWPVLLGALTWLLELIKYDESKAMKEDSVRENEEDDVMQTAPGLGQAATLREHTPLFVNNIDAAYIQFLQGADDFPELDRELSEKIEANSADVRQRLRVLEARVPERTELLAAMKSRPLPSKQLQAFRHEQEERYAKFETVIRSKTEYNASVERKLAEKRLEVDGLQHSVDEISHELDRLKKIVAEQEANSIDVKQIARDRANLKDALSKLLAERSAAATAEKAVEEELDRDTTSVIDGLRSYRRGAEALLFVPDTATNAKKVDYTLSLVSGPEQATPDSNLSKDVGKVVLPALRGLKDEHYKRHAFLRGEELSNQETVDAMEEDLLLLRDGQSKLQARFGKIDREYQAQKTAMAQQLAAHSEEMAHREEGMHERRRRAQETARESDRAVESLASQLRSFEENFATERARVGRSLVRIVERIRSHNVAITEETLRVARHFAEEKARAQEENVTVGGGNGE